MHPCLEHARGGNLAATEAVVDSLRPRIERMAAYYARRCGEDADDLLQEAWLGLIEALPALDLRIGSPEQYLIRRAKWRMLDAVKRARVRRCAALEEEALDLVAGGAQEEAVGRACVREFMGRLKAPQKAILDCLMAGLTWREAGTALGCTSANIAYHMRQIRRQYEEWSRA